MTPAGETSFCLRILATTDLHMQFAPHDYLSDRVAPGRGISSVAGLLPRLRDDFLATPGRAVLLVDNGDAFQGSPVSDAVQKGSATTHPMVQAMNVLGYDAATPGNHDFTYGLDFLESLATSARFPLVSTNIRKERDAAGTTTLAGLRRWAILSRRLTTADGTGFDIGIGIMGFAPPQTIEWERFSTGPGLAADPIVDAAASIVPRLRGAGADIVIALAHSGIADCPHFDRTENAVADLASVDGIDAIVAGHIHRVFPGDRWNVMDKVDPVRGTIAGTPVVMPGAYGSHLGRIDLDLERIDGRWFVRGIDCRAEPVPDGSGEEGPHEPDTLGAVVRQTHAATLRHIRQNVGITPRPIQSHFCLVAPCGALAIPARALIRHARRQPDLVGRGLPLLAAVSPFRAGGFDGAAGYVDIPRGTLQLRHATELYPFPNELCALELSGDQLRRWLERASRVFATITPGVRDQPLLDPAVPPYQFDVIHGLTYQIDPTRPEGRISDIRFSDGTPLGPDDHALLLTNSYRANGGGGYAAADEAFESTCEDLPILDIITDYFASSEFDSSPEEVWRFAPIPDTSAVFLSGAGAPAHLSSVKGRSIRHDGPADNGFHRFILDF